MLLLLLLLLLFEVEVTISGLVVVVGIVMEDFLGGTGGRGFVGEIVVVVVDKDFVVVVEGVEMVVETSFPSARDACKKSDSKF